MITEMYLKRKKKGKCPTMSSSTKPVKISCKRKALIDDNGEPVMVGKKKAVLPPAKKQKNAPIGHTKLATLKAAMATAPSKALLTKKSSTNQQVPTRSVSVEIEDMYDEQDHPHFDPPRNPQHILESVDSEEDDGPPPPAIDVDEQEDEPEEEEPEEDNDTELGWFFKLLRKFANFSIVCLSKDWTSPIYVFFRNTPQIEYKKDRQCHVFECAAGRCKSRSGRDVRRFLDKRDARSTSNLRKHAKGCWGDETVAAADETRDLEAARAIMTKSTLKDGSITAEFERIGRGKVTYSHRQHTTTESR